MDKFYADIGGRMRSVRKTLRLTQAQVAEASGIDASFYGQIERGRNVPSLKTFVAVAKALGVDPADLLSGEAGARGRYRGAVERLMSGLKPGKRRLMLGLVSDMVGRLKG